MAWRSRGLDVNSGVRLVASALVTLILAGTAKAAPSAAPLPVDVHDGLATISSIETGPPTGAPAQLPVTASSAKRIVRHHFGVPCRQKVGVYLVRITGHPGAFDPLPPGHGWTSIARLQVGDLVWIVVIRNAPIPVLAGAGGIVRETLAVIVETMRPRWVIGITIPPRSSWGRRQQSVTPLIVKGR
jgi:hypothetical protein